MNSPTDDMLREDEESGKKDTHIVARAQHVGEVAGGGGIIVICRWWSMSLSLSAGQGKTIQGKHQPLLHVTDKQRLSQRLLANLRWVRHD